MSTETRAVIVTVPGAMAAGVQTVLQEELHQHYGVNAVGQGVEIGVMASDVGRVRAALHGRGYETVV